MSGHTLKYLAAATARYWILRMLQKGVPSDTTGDALSTVQSQSLEDGGFAKPFYQSLTTPPRRPELGDIVSEPILSLCSVDRIRELREVTGCA